MAATTNNNPDTAAIIAVLQSISNQATSTMADIAADQAARADRLTTVRTRLQNNPQTPRATLQKLEDAISSSSTLARAMSSLNQRISNRPPVDPADLAVFGQVVDATGAAAPGLYVQLINTVGNVNVGSRAKTDASGDFSLVFKSCEIPSSPSELVVAVLDAAGARKATSNPITPKAGSPVYIVLSLSIQPSEPASK